MVWVISNTEAINHDEIKRNLDENKSDEAKDAFTANNFERMNIVLSYEFLFIHKLASCNHLEIKPIKQLKKLREKIVKPERI